MTCNILIAKIIFILNIILIFQNDDLRTMLLSLDPQKIEQLKALGESKDGLLSFYLSQIIIAVIKKINL